MVIWPKRPPANATTGETDHRLQRPLAKTITGLNDHWQKPTTAYNDYWLKRPPVYGKCYWSFSKTLPFRFGILFLFLQEAATRFIQTDLTSIAHTQDGIEHYTQFYRHYFEKGLTAMDLNSAWASLADDSRLNSLSSYQEPSCFFKLLSQQDKINVFCYRLSSYACAFEQPRAPPARGGKFD
ncbi:hypothetical protein BaRGS_00000733 [Batillaria attramentaria]|uniref:Uncharacterized protein n=1 Tax=Batillaria attramentaria TaxID=370345 RepID=A0ABD0M945_9CAEN